MYYSNGNYEAFARPKKPEGIDDKKAWIIGGGLAGMAAAAFLVRDAQMPGENITIFEAMKVDGGALDGAGNEVTGWLLRGGREMEAHFECLWDLYRSVPSLEVEGSVLDEFYWLNKEDPNFSYNRTTYNQGELGGIDPKFTLGKRGQKDLLSLVLAPPEDLYDKRINEVMSKRFFASNFWLYWRTMFAFEEWHSALELKLYVQRFIHDIAGLADFSALKFTRYNQYESLVLPLKKYLQENGVTFRNDTQVVDVRFDITKDRKQAEEITWIRDGKEEKQALTENDLVFYTNGSLVENSTWGDHYTPPVFDAEIREGGTWDLWRKIAKQDPSFGNPDNFCTTPEETYWESATITVKSDRIRDYIERVTKRATNTGHTVTGGIVTVKDSNWLFSWTVNRQGQFTNQPDDQTVVWFYGLFGDPEGNFIKKPLRECTGEEITKEWLWHLGVPEEEIDELASEEHVITRPCMLPFITAFFMPRNGTDRPKVVPDDVTNFAFIGQFAESTRDCVFTTEYSVRTGMEAVYQLAGVDRGVPEVFGSIYDVREMMKATRYMRDGKPLRLPKMIAKFVEGNEAGRLLAAFGLLPNEEDVPPLTGAVTPTGAN